MITVSDQSSMVEFLERTDFLHDALIRELYLTSRGYVAEDGRMFGDAEPCEGNVIIHSQNQGSPVIHLVFKELYRVSLDPSLELQAEGELDGERVILYPSGRSYRDRMLLDGKGLTYRILGAEFLGNTPSRIGL